MPMTQFEADELKAKYDALIEATAKHLTSWKDYYNCKDQNKKRQKLQIAVTYQKKVEELITPKKDNPTQFELFLAK